MSESGFRSDGVKLTTKQADVFGWAEECVARAELNHPDTDYPFAYEEVRPLLTDVSKHQVLPELNTFSKPFYRFVHDIAVVHAQHYESQSEYDEEVEILYGLADMIDVELQEFSASD